MTKYVKAEAVVFKLHWIYDGWCSGDEHVLNLGCFTQYSAAVNSCVHMYSLSLILPQVYKAHNYGIGHNDLFLVF